MDLVSRYTVRIRFNEYHLDFIFESSKIEFSDQI